MHDLERKQESTHVDIRVGKIYDRRGTKVGGRRVIRQTNDALLQDSGHDRFHLHLSPPHQGRVLLVASKVHIWPCLEQIPQAASAAGACSIF